MIPAIPELNLKELNNELKNPASDKKKGTAHIKYDNGAHLP
jgi:hypothetical protein